MGNVYERWMETAHRHVGAWSDSMPELWAICLHWRVWPDRFEEVSFEGVVDSGKGILWERSAFPLTAHQRLQQERTAPAFEAGLLLLVGNAAGPRLRDDAGTVAVLFETQKARCNEHPFFVVQTINPKTGVVERFHPRDHKALFETA